MPSGGRELGPQEVGRRSPERQDTGRACASFSISSVVPKLSCDIINRVMNTYGAITTCHLLKCDCTKGIFSFKTENQIFVN